MSEQNTGEVRVKKSVTRNAALNTIKTVMSLIFPLITFPYSSRILGTAGIGKYNFASSIITYFTLLACLGISMYAVREGSKYRDDKEKITQFCNEIFSINIYSLIFSYILLILSLVFIPKLHPYVVCILILSFRMILNSFSVNWIYSIFEDFTFITIVTAVMEAAAIAIMLLFVHTPSDLYIYVFSSLLAYSGAGLFMFLYSGKYIRLRFIPKVNFEHLKPILIIFSMEIGTTIYVSSDVTLLGWIDGDDMTGLYSTAAIIYKIVKQVMNAMVMVVVPRFSYHIGKEQMERENGNKEGQLQHHKTAEELGTLLVNTAVTIGLPATAGLFIMASPIVTLCAGNAFADAYSSLQILSFAILFAVLVTFYGECVMMAYKQETAFMYATLFTAVLNIVLNIILIPRFHQNAAAMTTVIAEFCMLVIMTMYSRKFIRISVKPGVLLSSAAGTAAVVAVCILTRRLITNDPLYLLVGIGISMLVYLVVIYLMHNDVLFSFLNKDKGQ